MVEKCLAMHASLMLDRTWWQEVPPSEAAYTTLFKTQAFAAATAFDNVGKRFGTYPYRLSELLVPGSDGLEEALCFASAPACTLDEFSLAFRREFPTAELLTTPLARTLLRALLSSFEGNTFSTEQLHSQNARRILSRKMTHELSIHQAALFHAGVGAPKHVASLACEQTGSILKRAREDPAPDDAPATKKRKKKGGGGAWRAFVHLQAVSADATQRGFRRNLRQQYASMDDETRQRCQELGRVATSLRRQGLPAFPRTPTQLLKQGPGARAAAPEDPSVPGPC